MRRGSRARVESGALDEPRPVRAYQRLHAASTCVRVDISGRPKAMASVRPAGRKSRFELLAAVSFQFPLSCAPWPSEQSRRTDSTGTAVKAREAVDEGAGGGEGGHDRTYRGHLVAPSTLTHTPSGALPCRDGDGSRRRGGRGRRVRGRRGGVGEAGGEGVGSEGDATGEAGGEAETGRDSEAGT